ncbi:TPA: hypothetical protein ACGQ50_000779 [Enterobacter cloacae]
MAPKTKESTATKLPSNDGKDWVERYEELLAKFEKSEQTNSELVSTNEQLIASNEELQRQLDEKTNSPVTPDGYVLMPVVPDEEMMIHGSDDQESPWDSEEGARGIRRRVLAAVTEVLLKRQ